MSHPTIPLYTGVVPNRSQSPIDFANNADDWLAYQAPLATDYNDLATYLDNLAITMQGIADDAQDSADASQASAVASASSAQESANYANLSASSANFFGQWASLTGALNKPASVEHVGGVWALLNNLADVTASEPGVTSDWVLISGQKYVTPVAGAELSTVLINSLKTSDTFKYPIAANVQAGLKVTVAILETYAGITPQIDLQGGDNITDGINTVSDFVTYSAGFTGLDDAVSNGVDGWEF